MQALEKIGVLEQDEDKGGRRITQSGQRDLDRKLNNIFLSRRLDWNGYCYCLEDCFDTRKGLRVVCQGMAASTAFETSRNESRANLSCL